VRGAGVVSALALLVAGCPRPAAVLPDRLPALGADLAPVAALAGHWQGPPGVEEHWLAAGPALVGIGFTANADGWFFEVMLLTARDGRARFVAFPGGKAGVVFVGDRRPDGFAVHSAENDWPQDITYVVAGDALEARLGPHPHGGEDILPFRRAPAPAPVPALEAADQAFDATTSTGGQRAWARQDGVRWRPLASALLGDGRAVGYTVGRYLRGREAGSYVTVWQRQPDGSWRVLFDTAQPD
jgi:hypothetical protein